jgi:hypothetical protein
MVAAGRVPHDTTDHIRTAMDAREAADPRWCTLYRMGGVAALMIGLLLLGELFVYAVLPRPSTAIEHFAPFRDNRLAGQLTLDLLGMIAYLLFVPTILARYAALRRTSESVMVVATALFFLGVADFFATNTELNSPEFCRGSVYWEAASRTGASLAW